MERERSERLNKLAAELEQRNEIRESGRFEFPLRRNDGKLYGIYKEPKK